MNERYFIPDWRLPHGLRAACSLRTGGVSIGRCASLNLGLHVGDDPRAVHANRALLARDLALPSEPLWLSQVHGQRVVSAEQSNPGDQAATVDKDPPADAIVARDSGVLAIQVADCLPVLFAADDGSVYAAAHAGWRGLAAGVLENALAACNLSPSRLCAWLGPCIRQAAFEVGADVRAAFGATYDWAFQANNRGRWQCDLAGIARAKLVDQGVLHVVDCGLCTYNDAARFFSHRRDAAMLGGSGRFAALIWRAR